MSKRRAKYDYIAEINLAQDDFVDCYIDHLETKYKKITDPVSDKPYTFISKNKKESMAEDIFYARPDYIEWSVEKISQGKCQVGMIFDISVSSKIGVYCMIFAPWLLLEFARILSIDFLGGYHLVIKAIAMGMEFFVVWRVINLMSSYHQFGHNVLLQLCKSLGIDSSILRKVDIKLPRKYFFDWKACCLVVVAPLLFSDIRTVFLELICSSVLFNAILLIGTFLCIIGALAPRGFLAAKKISPISANACITSLVILLLFAIPFTYSTFCQMAFAKSFNNILIFKTIHTHGVIFILLIYSLALGPILIAAYHLCKECIGGHKSYQQKDVKKTFEFQSRLNSLSGMTLDLPLYQKIFVWIVYACLSLCCWVGVLVNLSVINALVIPNVQIIPESRGATIVEAAKRMSYILTGSSQDGFNTYVWQIVLVAPVIIPFLIFVFCHVKFIRKCINNIKKSNLIPLNNDISEIAKKAAERIGVRQVKCYQDTGYKKPSPYAERVAIPPENRIIFSEWTLDFFNEHEDFVEALIVHELIHLKYDSQRKWLLRMLSRVGLVGVGFLSILLDSVKMEDRANEEAKKYFYGSGKNKNYYETAASTFELWCNRLAIEMEQQRTLTMGFSDSESENLTNVTLAKQSFFNRYCDMLKTAYEFYFETDIYDYIHRDIASRIRVMNS